MTRPSEFKIPLSPKQLIQRASLQLLASPRVLQIRGWKEKVQGAKRVFRPNITRKVISCWRCRLRVHNWLKWPSPVCFTSSIYLYSRSYNRSTGYLNTHCSKHKKNKEDAEHTNNANIPLLFIIFGFFSIFLNKLEQKLCATSKIFVKEQRRRRKKRRKTWWWLWAQSNHKGLHQD